MRGKACSKQRSVTNRAYIYTVPSLLYYYYFYDIAEGVLVCPKSFKGEKSLGKDADDKEIVVKTLFVIKMLQSLESRGLVRSTFCWQWFYYYLTDDGVAYLRTFLNLPAEIVPLTFKKTATSRPRTTDVRGDRPRFEVQIPPFFLQFSSPWPFHA